MESWLVGFELVVFKQKGIFCFIVIGDILSSIFLYLSLEKIFPHYFLTSFPNL